MTARGRSRSAAERSYREDEGIGGIEGVDTRGNHPGKKPGRDSRAADVLPEDNLVEDFHPLDTAPEIDEEGFAVCDFQVDLIQIIRKASSPCADSMNEAFS